MLFGAIGRMDGIAFYLILCGAIVAGNSNLWLVVEDSKVGNNPHCLVIDGASHTARTRTLTASRKHMENSVTVQSAGEIFRIRCAHTVLAAAVCISRWSPSYAVLISILTEIKLNHPLRIQHLQK